MKYLRGYKIFEENKIDSDKWENLKDIIQMEIMDKWSITNDLVTEVLPKRYDDVHELHMKINERFDNPEPVEIMADLRDLHSQVFALTGLFISVLWSSQKIIIRLHDFPNHYTIMKDFNLDEIEDDNTIDRKGGGLCDIDEALKIIKYLNGFYRFAYDSDISLFQKCYDVLDELYVVDLVFSLPRFEKERFRQNLCFKFKLSTGKERVIGKHFPIFMFDTNHTDSPYIRKRTGNYSWIEKFREKNMIDFLKTEQF